MQEPDIVAKVREGAERLRASLPQSLSVAALGVKSKAPYQLLCTREALIWRTEELTRNACDALEKDDFAVAAILARAITENAAMTWALMVILKERSKYTVEKLNDLLMRFLTGAKWDDAPKPMHVNDLLRQIDKGIPGVMASYDLLSETAHPNWSGVLGLYSKIDEPNFTTYFGRGLRGVEQNREKNANVILAALAAFEVSYNRVSDMMPVFLEELEKL